jgi:3-deoxy-D-manno-octulosonic-acid transferase
MLHIYRYLTFLLFPAFVILIYLRSIFNKEDQVRYKEKIFSSSFKVNRNAKKKLFWFHAASIGEVMSILTLIQEINISNKNIDFLITSVTLSSARLLDEKLVQYKNITHRFFPLDTEILANNFLTLWKPDLIFFVESEIWPNFLFKIKEKKIPLILINGRITKKTFNKWEIISSFAKKVFENFDLCLAASEASRDNLEKLYVKNLKYIGNLKFSSKKNIENLNTSNIKILNNFKTWCAVSTHEGEESLIIKTHLEIKKKYNNTLTIIIPRHIHRVSSIKNLSKEFNLNAQILNKDDSINASTEILIINSFGTLSKYFNYCKNIFIGKSFLKKLEQVGGQNPIEAAKLGCKIFHGPYVYNFQEIYKLLNSYGISEQVDNEIELSNKIIKNFQSPNTTKGQQIESLSIYGEKILKQTVTELDKFIR